MVEKSFRKNLMVDGVDFLKKNNATWWLTPTTSFKVSQFFPTLTFKTSKSVLLALPRLKVLLVDNFCHDIKDR